MLEERRRLLGEAEEKAAQKEVKKPITKMPRPSPAFLQAVGFPRCTTLMKQ